MCIQAIAGLLTGQYNLGQALNVEAQSWTGGAGGARGGAHACASHHERCGSGASMSHFEGRGSRAHESDALSSGCGSQHGEYERTTTQTHYSPDGSVTRSTSHMSSSGADGNYGRHGEAFGEQHGYGFAGQDDRTHAASFSYRSTSAEGPGGAFSSGGFGQAGGSVAFAGASAALPGLFGLGSLLNLLGMSQAQTA